MNKQQKNRNTKKRKLRVKKKYRRSNGAIGRGIKVKNMKKKFEMKVKTHKQQLEKEATELWKQACLKRYGDKSEISGKPISTFHHFIPKSRNGLLKFDVENGVGLTLKEHFNIHFSPNPVVIHDLVEAIEKKRGRKWRQYIDKKQEENRNTGGYKSIKWYQEQINKLKELL